MSCCSVFATAGIAHIGGREICTVIELRVQSKDIFVADS